MTASPARLLERLDRALAAVSRVFLTLGALATIGIFVLLFFATLRRYLFGAPLNMTEELSAILFVALSFFAIPYGFYAGQQIRLLVVWRKLPPAIAQVAVAVGDILGAAVLVILSIELYEFTRFSYEVSSLSEIADIMLWPWMAIMPAMLGLLALGMTVRALLRLAHLGEGRYDELSEGASLE